MDCGTETVTMLHTSGLLWLYSAVSTICLSRFSHCSFFKREGWAVGWALGATRKEICVPHSPISPSKRSNTHYFTTSSSMHAVEFCWQLWVAQHKSLPALLWLVVDLSNWVFCFPGSVKTNLIIKPYEAVSGSHSD